MTVTYKVKNLRLGNTMKQVGELLTISDPHIYLDFSSMTVARSSGMIIFASTIESMRKKGFHFYCNKNASYFSDYGYHACSYCKYIGFFNALGFDIGKKMGEASGSKNYVPINQITMSDLYKIDPDYHYGIKYYSKRLSEVLTSDIIQFRPVFQYLITEIIRNTFEHTTAKHVWIAAQRHETENVIEVAIADNAEGIRQVLSVNKKVAERIENDIDALKYAVKPGISGNAKSQKNTSDYWANSGYGLYVTSEILKLVGDLYLISGSAIMYINNGKASYYSCPNYKGTAVVLQIRIDKAGSIDDSVIDDVVKAGEAMAANEETTVKRASKASRME